MSEETIDHLINHLNMCPKITIIVYLHHPETKAGPKLQQ